MKPIYIVPLFGLDSEGVSPQKLCFASNSCTNLIAGSLNGDLVLADLKKAEGKDSMELSRKAL